MLEQKAFWIEICIWALIKYLKTIRNTALQTKAELRVKLESVSMIQEEFFSRVFCLPQQKLTFSSKLRKTWKNVFCLPMMAQTIVNLVLLLSPCLVSFDVFVKVSEDVFFLVYEISTRLRGCIQFKLFHSDCFLRPLSEQDASDSILSLIYK